MKNVVWDVTPCGSFKNRSFRGTYRFIIRVERISQLGTTLVVTHNLEEETGQVCGLQSAVETLLTRVVCPSRSQSRTCLDYIFKFIDCANYVQESLLGE
jgi:hypothetical protein